MGSYLGVYLRGFFILASLTFLSSCGEPQHDPGSDQVGKPSLKQALKNPEMIDFSMIQQFVLAQNCVSCHNSTDKRDNVDLTSYTALLGQRSSKSVVVAFDSLNSSLYNTLIAKGDRKMPPVGRSQLSSDQIELVKLWIDKGAQESACQPRQGRRCRPTGPLPIDIALELNPYFENPETIDYKVVDKYFFQATSCNKCHSASGEAKDDWAMMEMETTNYESVVSGNIMGAAPAVVKGQPQKSTALLSTTVRGSMPPRKQGYPLVNSYRNELLRLWILNCAIEDFSQRQTEELIEGKRGKRRRCDRGEQ